MLLLGGGQPLFSVVKSINYKYPSIVTIKMSVFIANLVTLMDVWRRAQGYKCSAGPGRRASRVTRGIRRLMKLAIVRTKCS